jgi:TusA-related sulfurtransferase
MRFKMEHIFSAPSVCSAVKEKEKPMAERIDARGLSCPQPVLLARNKMNEAGSGTIEVLADSPAARDNISRLAAQQGWGVSVEERENEFLLTLTRP